VVRITSPVLNMFIIGGVILFYLDVCLFVSPTFTPSVLRFTCNLTAWLTIIAHTFCFGTIMAKMLRVWLIFRDPFQRKSTTVCVTIIHENNVKCYIHFYAIGSVYKRLRI